MFRKLAIWYFVKKAAGFFARRKTYLLLAAAAYVVLNTITGGDPEQAKLILDDPSSLDPEHILTLLAGAMIATVKMGLNREAKKQLDAIQEVQPTVKDVEAILRAQRPLGLKGTK